MAEQNRRTTAQIAARKVAEELVTRFLLYCYKADLIDDIAKEGRNQLGMALEFGGVPASSGFSGFCKLAGKVDRINRERITEEEYGAATIMALLGDKQVQALCVDRAMRGHTTVIGIDPFREDQVATKYWGDQECADYLSCTVKVFQRRVSDGYKRLDEILQGAQQKAA